jgi:hypothetical protein
MSQDFIAASQAAAKSPASDAKEVRQLFRAISTTCTDCHDSR